MALHCIKRISGILHSSAADLWTLALALDLAFATLPFAGGFRIYHIFTIFSIEIFGASRGKPAACGRFRELFMLENCSAVVKVK